MVLDGQEVDTILDTKVGGRGIGGRTVGSGPG